MSPTGRLMFRYELVAYIGLTVLFAVAGFGAALTGAIERETAFVAPLLVKESECEFYCMRMLPTAQTAREVGPETGLTVRVRSGLLQIHTNGTVSNGLLHLLRILFQNLTEVSCHMTRVVIATHFGSANMTGLHVGSNEAEEPLYPPWGFNFGRKYRKIWNLSSDLVVPQNHFAHVCVFLFFVGSRYNLFFQRIRYFEGYQVPQGTPRSRSSFFVFEVPGQLGALRGLRFLSETC
jgi:hypothetical protein